MPALPARYVVGRSVLALALATTAAPAPRAADGRRTIPLRGPWRIEELAADPADAAAVLAEAERAFEPGGKREWLETSIPAQVHDVLLETGKIPDPRVGRNAAASTWVAERDWVYATRFPTPRGAAGSAFLRFAGVDTLATAWLNGHQIGRFDDRHRR